MQTLDLVFFIVVGSLTLLMTLVAILWDLKIVCNKVTKENEYYLHLVLLAKSLNTALYIVDGVKAKNEVTKSYCQVSEAIKMVSYDVGMMISLSYLHLFRMNVKNAKNQVRRNLFSVFLIIDVPAIRVIFTNNCEDSESTDFDLSPFWPILSIPYIIVNRYKLKKVFK